MHFYNAFLEKILSSGSSNLTFKGELLLENTVSYLFRHKIIKVTILGVKSLSISYLNDVGIEPNYELFRHETVINVGVE